MRATEHTNGDLHVIYRTADGVDHTVVIPKRDRSRLYTVGDYADYVMDAVLREEGRPGRPKTPGPEHEGA